MDYELTDKIRSSVVWTSEDLNENLLAKKTEGKLCHCNLFPSKLSESGQQKWSASR